HHTMPPRGPLAACTVAGTVSGWQAALDIARDWGRALPLGRLLEDAIHYAGVGVPLTKAHHLTTLAKRADLETVPGFAETFLDRDAVPAAGTPFRQPRLAASLRALADNGLMSFYRGPLGEAIAADLARIGAPVTREDLARHAAIVTRPLSVRLRHGTVYNMVPPTQGLASLMILGLYDRVAAAAPEGFDYVHLLVEATKQAFIVRDRHVTDPDFMRRDPAEFVAPADLDRRAARIDPARALAWPAPPNAGDTIWMGAIDAAGRTVSFIQSIYWEFGSGVVLEDTGILWQNRGTSFSLEAGAKDPLQPGRKPFHTLNPALAELADGRVMAYGCMGGEGQPQTQAAVFTRHVHYGQELQAAVTAPRWLFGRNWGAQSTTLKIEDRFDPAVYERLRAAGHAVEVVEPITDLMGHAGALVRHPSGVLEGAGDPRSDGGVALF
ncbi:MAG: gamma-glutamyltransferase, partial [Alphaproteobacteria bacterium]|nr:gamma-glutamyltransferase [Alphaproteobacteria bacterium]